MPEPLPTPIPSPSPTTDVSKQIDELTARLGDLSEQVSDLTKVVESFEKLAAKFSELIDNGFGGGDTNVILANAGAATNFARKGYQVLQMLHGPVGQNGSFGNIGKTFSAATNSLQQQGQFSSGFSDPGKVSRVQNVLKAAQAAQSGLGSLLDNSA